MVAVVCRWMVELRELRCVALVAIDNYRESIFPHPVSLAKLASLRYLCLAQEHARLEEPVLENGSLLMVKSRDEELEPVSMANRWEPDRLGGEVEAIDGLEEQEPAWNSYDSDDWLKKAQSLERLVFAARRVIMQNRVQKRINSLQVRTISS